MRAGLIYLWSGLEGGRSAKRRRTVSPEEISEFSSKPLNKSLPFRALRRAELATFFAAAFKVRIAGESKMPAAGTHVPAATALRGHHLEVALIDAIRAADVASASFPPFEHRDPRSSSPAQS